MAFNPTLDGHKINMRSEYADTVTHKWTRAEVDNIMQQLLFDANSSSLASEAMTLDAVDAEWMGEMMVLDSAVITTNMRTLNGKFTESISRTLDRKLLPALSISSSEVGKVKKSGLYASIAAIFHVSDGQTVTIIFHAPDGDPKVISPDDTLIAFRVLMNKTDITSHVLPQLISTKGVTSLDQVSTNITSLLKANSDTFKGKQTQIANQKKELEAKSAELHKLESAQVEAVQMEADAEKRMTDVDEKGAGMESRIKRVEEDNAVLQEKIDKLKAKKAEVQPESQPSKKPISIDALVAIGGKKWESSDKSKSRVYFGVDFISKAKGFEYTTYKTGNISSASLKGEPLSNSKAKSLLSSIASGKFWYDVNSSEFVSDGFPNSHAEIEAFIRESLKSVHIPEKGEPSESQETEHPEKNGDDELFIAQLVSDLESSGFILDNPNKRRPWLKEMGKGDWLLTILDKSGKYESVYGAQVNTSRIEVLNEATDDSTIIKFGVNSGDSMTAHDVADKVMNIVDAPTAPEAQPEPEVAPMPAADPYTPRIEALIERAKSHYPNYGMPGVIASLEPLLKGKDITGGMTSTEEQIATAEKAIEHAESDSAARDKASKEDYQAAIAAPVGRLKAFAKDKLGIDSDIPVTEDFSALDPRRGDMRIYSDGFGEFRLVASPPAAGGDIPKSRKALAVVTREFKGSSTELGFYIGSLDEQKKVTESKFIAEWGKYFPRVEQAKTSGDGYASRIEALRTIPLKEYETAMDALIAELEDAGKLADYEAVLTEIDKARDEDLKKLVEGA